MKNILIDKYFTMNSSKTKCSVLATRDRCLLHWWLSESHMTLVNHVIELSNLEPQEGKDDLERC